MDSLGTQFYKAFIKSGRWQLYLKGLGSTLEVTLFAALLGLLLGTVACLFNMQRSRRGKRTVGSVIAYVYIDIIRGTPTMIQLLIMWNVILATSKNKVLVASLAFGINSGAYVAEIIRGGIQSVDAGQMEAGRSLGLSRMQTMQFVILPQAFKNCFPSLLNEVITLLKETSIAGVVGLSELTHASDQVSSATYQYLMPLLGAAALYFAVVKLLSFLFGLLEKKLRESDLR
ncbi:MAG: amino acid ABC transporter permease [Lachnospiraceae bacterium]|jgi:His/Glu/Gln/Arg/opine family amino acid ABC transporter permease subunit|nr:amino acid ABC transporter permease [Lachnospiraceae bacterium]